jgi:hypothetical protein
MIGMSWKFNFVRILLVEHHPTIWCNNRVTSCNHVFLATLSSGMHIYDRVSGEGSLQSHVAPINSFAWTQYRIIHLHNDWLMWIIKVAAVGCVGSPAVEFKFKQKKL